MVVQKSVAPFVNRSSILMPIALSVNLSCLVCRLKSNEFSFRSDPLLSTKPSTHTILTATDYYRMLCFCSAWRPLPTTIVRKKYDYFRSFSGISSRPIHSHRDRNQSVKRLLVITSAMLSVVETFSRLSFSLVTQSRTKWYWTSICLETSWCTRFFAKATTPWLSLSTV
jgi:hypothetical protein